MQLADKAKSLNGVQSSCPIWSIEDQAQFEAIIASTPELQSPIN